MPSLATDEDEIKNKLGDETKNKLDDETKNKLDDETKNKLGDGNEETLVNVAERKKYLWPTESPASLIGYGLNLSCIWTLPTAAMANGGVAFLIPYSVLTLIFGVSYYTMQMALGQYSSQGVISVWHCVPIMKGIGFATVATTTVIAFYYSVVMSWALQYLVLSFSSPTVPWRSCTDPQSNLQSWASTNCFILNDCTAAPFSCINYNQGIQGIFKNYSYGIKDPNTPLILPAEQYFHSVTLELSSGIQQGNGIVGRNFLAYLAVMVIVSVICIRSTRSLSKVSVVLCPIMIGLGIAVLIRVCMESGADRGILLFLQPQWNSLARIQTWGEAGVTAFFTTLPSWGAVTTIGSFNRFNYNFHRHALVSVIFVLLFSLLFGLLGAAFTGIVAKITNTSQASWLIPYDSSGSSIVFVLAAQALASFGQIWSILFYLFISLLTLTTLCWLTETIVIGIVDIFPKRRHFISFITRKVLIGILVLLGLAGTSRAGLYVVLLIEAYTWKMTVMLFALAEILFISWAYGADKLLANILQMNGSTQSKFVWNTLWKIIVPILVVLCLIYTWIMAIISDERFTPSYGIYAFPEWAKTIGWLIMLLPLLFIPIFAIIPFCKRSGNTFKEVFKAILKADSKWHPEGQTANAADGEGSTMVDGVPLDTVKWGRIRNKSIPAPGLKIDSMTDPQQPEQIETAEPGDRDAEQGEGAENTQENPTTASDIGTVLVPGSSQGDDSRKRRHRHRSSRKNKDPAPVATSEQVDEDGEKEIILPPIDRKVMRVHSTDDETAIPPPLGEEPASAEILPSLTELPGRSDTRREV